MKEPFLQKDLRTYLRIGPVHAKALARLGITSVKDLLYTFPLRYTGNHEIRSIKKLKKDEDVVIYAMVKSINLGKTFRGKVPHAQAQVEDSQGDRIKIIWFHQAYIAKKIHEGDFVKLTGKVSARGAHLSLVNPEYELISSLPDEPDSLFGEDQHTEMGFPVYRETRGVSSKWIYHAILKIIKHQDFAESEDPLPPYIKDRYHLPSFHTAMVWIHAPKSNKDAKAAKKRFAFEEIFLIQLANQQRRKKHEALESYELGIDDRKMKTFIERFPFTPTKGQSAALQAILKDMSSSSPMIRLLEGDVGSGKTFVAAAAAFATITNQPRKQSFGKLQVAYMAPTEVLATQLFENFISYFKGSGVQIALVTGSGCRKFPSKVDHETWTSISRSQLTKWIAQGEIPIVIGTHALIQKKISFKDLALIIIDEQHRFGTRQRMELGKKDHRIPHYLSMTATPIPRTLALTIFGDLDLSVIPEMPTGRKTVITEIVKENKGERELVYEAIKARLDEGRQAYVICPRIDEADPEKASSLQLKSVKEEAQRLAKEELKGYRIDIMHSKMKKQEKESIMQKFYAHEIDVLVSTSVVEVGVNVPNATSIIIEGAERFGLAQLHQLRGRVIRSEHQAYCYLFANTTTEKSLERLKALVQAKNGFELAEYDLQMRGSGDLFGNKQWGMSDLAMEAIRNVTMVEYAQKEAREIIQNDPTLENFPLLQQRTEKEGYDVHFE